MNLLLILGIVLSALWIVGLIVLPFLKLLIYGALVIALALIIVWLVQKVSGKR